MLYITIMLSLVFLCRALVDLMFAFNLLNDTMSNNALLFTIIFLSEIITAFGLVRLIHFNKPNDVCNEDPRLVVTSDHDEFGTFN